MEGMAGPDQDHDASSDDPFCKLIEQQTKQFEEFGKQMNLQQTKIFDEFSKQLGLGLHGFYREYLKQQNNERIKIKNNFVEIEQKYEEKIDHLKTEINGLKQETNDLRRYIDIRLVHGYNNNRPSRTLEAARRMDIILAKRPEKPGIAGREVELSSNFIAVSKFNYPVVHYYSFKVRDKKKKASKKDSKKAFEQMKREKFFGKNVSPVYDGGSVYSIAQLAIGHSKKTRSHEVKIPVDADGSGREKNLMVEVKYQGEIDFSPIGEYVRKGSRDPWSGRIQNILTALNAFVNSKVRSSYLPALFEKFIFPPNRDNGLILLPGGIEMRHGFYQSIKPGWEKLLINVSTRATFFYPAGPIIDIIPKVIKSKQRYEKTRDELRRGLNKQEIENLNGFLRGVTIFVTHRSDNRKPKYKISFVDTQPADLARFKHENREITVAQYFKETYKQPLQYGRLPCIVVVKPDRSRSYFPLEVCEICPGQKYKGLVNEGARVEMYQKTAVKPWERFNRINTAIREIFQHKKDENLRSIGMDVNPEFIKIKGRVLPSPKLITRGSVIIPNEGRWDLKKFIKCPELYNWSVMVFENKNYCPQEMVRNGLIQLRNSLSERGMNVSTEPRIEYANPHDGYDKSLSIAFQNARMVKEKPPQLIICIIQKKVLGPMGIYAIIKRICSTQLGVISQCIISVNMKTNRWRQICNNISLKINGKLGGISCNLAGRELNFGTNLPYMVFGANIIHPGEGERGRPSIAAVCASMDSQVTRYVARYSVNRYVQNEIIENLEGMIVELLAQFQRENKKLPFQIVFYRAGGPIKHIEVSALKRAFNRVYDEKEKRPQLTFIITQKRRYARFMPNNKQEASRSGNCRPGTIVDTGVVVPQEFEFYLQSHATPLGTARPTHYHVLLNEANFPVDAMQSLTYKLCHLSARCNFSISRVIPVNYAYHAAKQARNFYISSDERDEIKCERLNSMIENMMFFI